MIDGRMYKWKDTGKLMVMLGWNFETIMFGQFDPFIQSEKITSRSIIAWPVLTPKQVKNDLEEVGHISDYPNFMERLKLNSGLIRPNQSVDKG